MFDARLKRLRTRLRNARLSALLVITHEDGNNNLRYLSGFAGSFGALLVSARGVYLSTDGRYLARAKKEAPLVALIPAPNERRTRHSAHVISELLKRANLPRNARVGFESHRVSLATANAWRRELGARLVPTEFLVERLRQYKDEKEIIALRSACRVTDTVFRVVVPRVKAGMRERDVALLIDHELRRRGAALPSFPTIVASGPNSAIPHHDTGSRKLRAGEPVVLDFGGRFPSGYCSDITRTIFVPGKRPHPKLLEVYSVVLEANRRAKRALRAGMSWKEYNAAARSFIESKGYGKQFLHSVGHSLGLDVHDPFDYANDPILPDTVLTDEPGIYIEGLGGVRIEDDLVVTARGVRQLTHAPYLL